MRAVIEVYEFALENSTTKYLYTSGQDDVVTGGNTYFAVPLQRSNIVSASNESSNLNIKCDRNNEVALLYRHLQPNDRVNVKVSTWNGVFLTPIWYGIVNSVSWNSQGAVLDCVDMLVYENILAFPQTYSKNCRHMLYGDGCRLVATDPAHQGVINITALNPSTRTITFNIVTAGFTNLMCVGGSFDNNDLEVLSISGGVGTIADPVHAKMSDDIAPLTLGNVVLKKGCNRTLYACRTRFNNVDNFGGFVSIPSKDFAAKIRGE